MHTALELCNACDAAPAAPDSPAGYCPACERDARHPAAPPVAGRNADVYGWDTSVIAELAEDVRNIGHDIRAMMRDYRAPGRLLPESLELIADEVRLDGRAVVEVNARLGAGHVPAHRYTFTLERDEFMSPLEFVNDMGDVWGRVEWADSPGGYRYAEWPSPRPAGFTGAAVKLFPAGWALGPGAIVWWEPPPDMRRPDDMARLRPYVLNALENGAHVLTVELEVRCDCCAQWSTIAIASLGGLEAPGAGSDDGGWLAEVVEDMAREVEQTADALELEGTGA